MSPKNYFIWHLGSTAIPFCPQKKSRIRETKHISTDANSSTDTIIGWTKNTPRPDFFEKRKKSFKTQKLKNIKKYAKISDTPFDQRSLNFFEKRKKIIKNTKTQKRLDICQNQRYALQPEVSNPSGSVVSWWTKNFQKPDFLEKRKKSSQT